MQDEVAKFRVVARETGRDERRQFVTHCCVERSTSQSCSPVNTHKHTHSNIVVDDANEEDAL